MDNVSLQKTNPHPWQVAIAKYQSPNTAKSVWQLANTLGIYAVLWFLMVKTITISWWLTLPLMVLAAGMLLRTFIIFHDCGHGSFFKSRAANQFWGYITGVLVFTSGEYWWHEHAKHHAQAGDLDQRGSGDIWTLTAKEYLASSPWIQTKYRVSRNPLFLFLIGPAILFIILHRLPFGNKSQKAREGINRTNLGLLVFMIVMSLLMGWGTYLAIQLPVIIMAASMGVWLFYVQHQFDEAYWRRHESWDYVDEALKGSSFYQLPKILQWFTGNIGYHHVHHLSPRIPNYHLEQCHAATSVFTDVKVITLASSLKLMGLALWDEDQQRLIGFRELKHDSGVS